MMRLHQLGNFSSRLSATRPTLAPIPPQTSSSIMPGLEMSSIVSVLENLLKKSSLIQTAAVMVLSSTQTTADIFTRDIPLARGDGSIFKAMGINPAANNQLTDFLKVVDDPLLAPLTARLQLPTLPGSPNPSALYCTATIAGYQTCVRLEYAISPKDSPIGKVITWIKDTLNFDINITIPDIQVTSTKTITYALDILDNPTQAPVEEWTVSFQFVIPDCKFALDFSDADTVCYLIPTGSISQIMTNLDTAVGSTAGLDQMYVLSHSFPLDI